jgi:GNAT superfamily N-acetyltransferase
VVTEVPRVRRATPDDFDDLLGIRERVAIDLLERGVPSNPNALTREHLQAWAMARVLWVGEMEERIVGSIAVWMHDPAGYWPRADVAAYVRDLMVDPRLRGLGVGAVLLAWAERYAAGLGRGRVRLDCDAANERLCRYYKEAGYRHVATDHDGFALFEKTLI